MTTQTQGFTIDGINAQPVNVEVDVQRGLPSFQIIGLPDMAVREARERIRAALVNCGYEFPLRRITVNLLPANLRKCGPALDLAIAVGLLEETGEVSVEQLEGFTFAAELALDGSLRPVRGAIAMAEAARDRDAKSAIIVAPGNGPEAAMVHGIAVRTISDIGQLRKFGKAGYKGAIQIPRPERSASDTLPDLADLRGQDQLRTTLEVAAAGGHNMLMVGGPGSGKSLAARRLPSILPSLDKQETLEIARIQSSCGVGNGSIPATRPFRAPHHTVSTAGLVGGGAPLRPGEITLAHRGVLFLDEIVEFRRPALEALRGPVHDKTITVARASHRKAFPAAFQLIATATPCPCGRGGDHPECRCSDTSVARYQMALNGAIGNLVDIHIDVEAPSAVALAGEPGESSAKVRDRVTAARERMRDRYGSSRANAEASPADVSEFRLTEDAHRRIAAERMITGRSAAQMLKLARTVADLADSSQIHEEHINEALTHAGRPPAAAA